MSGPRMDPRLLSSPLQGVGRSIEEVKEEFGITEVIKLAANESPVGPSPMAVEAARQALADAHRYPGSLDRDLRRRLASRIDPTLDETNILIGNGGTDVLRMITQGFVFDGGNTIMSRASFPMYHVFTHMFGGETRAVEPTSDHRHDLRAMSEAIDDDTRLVYLCSPNNPTGHILTAADVGEFLDRVPEHVVVVYDESYLEFVTDPDVARSIAFLREGHNILIARSFSKTAGLANLRVGYLVGSTTLVDYVGHARLPYHVSDVCLAAAMASLDDTAHLARVRDAVIEGREQLTSGMEDLHLTVLPSQANFVTFVDPPAPPNELASELLKRGFITQAMAPFGLPDGLRVSVGTADEIRRFLVALREVLSAAGVGR